MKRWNFREDLCDEANDVSYFFTNTVKHEYKSNYINIF